MSANEHIALAAAAMAVLTFLVGARLFTVRLTEMTKKRLKPQDISTSTQAAQRLEQVQVSDNFKNLFEVPVLFYALCALLIATGHAAPLFVCGAWVFVGLRCLHSLIHCTYNKVMHRFAAFVLALIALAAMWIAFILRLLEKGG